MSGSTDSETHDGTAGTHDGTSETHDETHDATTGTRDRTAGTHDGTAETRDRAPRDPDGREDPDPAEPEDEAEGGDEDPEDEGEDEDGDEDPEARRARWTAIGTGVLLTVAGLAASAMRTGGSGSALIPLSYASGAILCAGASALGARGRTRRALWLMIAGVMVMAVGDQLD
ncbi:hypothetical protein ACFRIC_28045 [Streptomyces sp. NPDC056738]|uniref:hypothetical protein n=1 Tax=Streptomyces sp. NPDC056738 TaxID=3345933 RepID=UPI0036A1E73F